MVAPRCRTQKRLKLGGRGGCCVTRCRTHTQACKPKGRGGDREPRCRTQKHASLTERGALRATLPHAQACMTQRLG
eukprot:2176092-Pleurochrysis_carterae.AAC.1